MVIFPMLAKVASVSQNVFCLPVIFFRPISHIPFVDANGVGGSLQEFMLWDTIFLEHEKNPFCPRKHRVAFDISASNFPAGVAVIIEDGQREIPFLGSCPLAQCVGGDVDSFGDFFNVPTVIDPQLKHGGFRK